jgi:DNA-binding transcriptional ArsR family regulator
MDMAKYFVTARGLSEAFTNERVLENITRILQEQAPKPVVQTYLSQGLIDIDRRPTRQVDHNAIILSGVMDRLRAVVRAESRPTEPRPPPLTDVGDTLDRRRIPKRMYRLTDAAGRLTPADEQRLISGARRVLHALRQAQIGTTRSLAEATGLNKRTVENALLALRREKLVVASDFDGG